jgi:hypothetical protein
MFVGTAKKCVRSLYLLPIFSCIWASLAVQNRQLVALKRTKGAKTCRKMGFKP